MRARGPIGIEDLIDRGGARLVQRVQRDGAAIEVYEDHRYRWLQNDNGTLQSLMDRRSPERLVLPYTAAMMAGLLFVDGPPTVLMLGLGGASQVRFLRRHFADTRITAWESDPDVIAIARRHFCLSSEDEAICIINEDARHGIAADGSSTNLILMDLFGADGSPPWVHEKAIHESCRRRLGRHGVLVANFWLEDDDESLAAMDGIQSAFENRTLVLGVPGYRNHIVFAFKDAPCLNFTALYTRAASLGKHTGIDYTGFISRMRESNPSGESEFEF